MEFILIIDGNYILSKNVFVLNKHKVLFGELYKSLNTSFEKYVSLGIFSGIYFVSDSKTKSWRKIIHDTYKSTRKRDTEIDWDFVHGTYDKFKSDIMEQEKAVVLESPNIEGDDWIHILTKLANKENKGAFIISGDGDLKQLLTSSISTGMMNVMLDDYVGRERFYVPESYDIINANSLEEETDIFNIKHKFDLNSIANKYSNIIQVDNKRELFIKLIIGDSSDNIPSIYETKSEKKPIGIGKSTGNKIYEKYIENSIINENNEIPVDINEIIQLIHDVRKIPADNTEVDDEINMKLRKNISLIHLHHKHIPQQLKVEISNKLKEYFNNEQKQHKEGRA